MIQSNPIFGTGLHAIGGISASSCYTPQTKVKNWSWGTFWLVQAFFAWIFIPILAGWLTVPGLDSNRRMLCNNWLVKQSVSKCQPV